MTGNTRGTAGAAKKRTPRGRTAAAGAKKAARKPVGTGTKPGAKAGIRKETGYRAAPARGKRATRPITMGGKIASALQAMVDAVADSDLLHGRSPPRARSRE